MDINKKAFWENRYAYGDTPWDIGYASPALINYCKKKDLNLKILIPGGGRAYELGVLFDIGFTNVYLCDWSPTAIEEAQKLNPSLPNSHFIESDYFLMDERFDLILEQTFFCALPPELRGNYMKKTHDLLNEGGYLAGLFFDTQFDNAGPPFGGSQKEYLELLDPYFEILEFEPAKDSISPRLGFELFLEARKK